MLILAVASLVLGALTWRFVEQPFRNKKHSHYVSGRPAFFLASVLAAFCIAIGVHGYLSEGRMRYWEGTTTPTQLRAYQLLTQAKSGQGIWDNGDCVFRVETLDEAAESRLIMCHKKYGSGIAIIGDSHAAELLGVLEESRSQALFIADFSQGMCRPHSPLPRCKYEKVLRLLEKHPALFHDVIYEQAGAHLFVDERGRATDRNWFLNLHIDEPVRGFTLNTDYIDAVIVYLSKIIPYARVTWLRPRIEPQIRESDIIRLGCNHAFTLRPNLQKLFEDLDQAIQLRVAKTAIHYISQIDLLQFDIKQDFMSCDAIYWIDGDHFSPAGRQRFGKRVTLEKLLQP